MFLFCLAFAMFCARLFICALWSPAGKGLASWLSFVVSSVSLSLSHWYPGSGVVLDCIDSWSLHHYLLLLIEKLVLRITICHHKACKGKFISHRHTWNGFFLSLLFYNSWIHIIKIELNKITEHTGIQHYILRSIWNNIDINDFHVRD